MEFTRQILTNRAKDSIDGYGSTSGVDMTARTAIAGAVLAWITLHGTAAAQAPSPRPLSELVAEFVVGSRILADQGVIADGFGHLSFRSSTDSSRFYMARARAAGMITQDDVLEFDLDGAPRDARGARLFSERFIHAEIYRARADVMAVVHSHAASVLPFGVTGTPLGPVAHMGGFLPRAVPVFEIRDAGGAETNMLVQSRALGAALAGTLGAAPVVLMRGHGFNAVGTSIKQAVFRAVYTDINARVLTEALKMGPVTYLNEREAARVAEANDASLERSWEIWAFRALANTPKL
jgi:HCOMODA/2-hydroxy-3-carboxy-muconic semialdehyde decarboxylase